MNTDQIKDLLRRYSSRETSHQEDVLVERWLEESDNSGSDWFKLDNAGKEQWLSGVFSDIQRSITKADVPAKTLRYHNLLGWRAIAAIAAVMTIFSILYLGWPTFRERVSSTALTSSTMTMDQKKLITLSDSSQVWVNAGSTLTYPVNFDRSKREVWLSGEAYFDVHHDAGHPFIIHTGDLVTTVLGTAFNIKEDKQHLTIAVTVTRGKVSVAKSDKILGILTPDQQLTFYTANDATVQKVVNTQQVVAWQQNDLHFDDVSFADAAKRLEQHFGVKISFANEKLKDCRFTGTTIQGDDLKKILKVLCAFNNATYIKGADGNIIVNGAGCDE